MKCGSSPSTETTTYELDFANFLHHLGPSSKAASATPVYVLEKIYKVAIKKKSFVDK